MTSALALLSAVAWGASPEDEGQAVLSIPVEQRFLSNGLQVLLSQDPDIPMVRVEVWYHVGSKDEPPGRTGFAHLFEHLMFQGSLHQPDDYFVPLKKIGATVNGSTSQDRTRYFQELSSRYLPLALWLEADRMGFLLPALTPEKLANQQDVVRNERRQSYENRPYGDVWLTILGEVFPPGHPYHHPTIGSHEDVEGATMEDVEDFFHTWYVPNNATLSIVGDFDVEEAMALVEGTFGLLPGGDEPVQATAPPVSLEDERVVRQERAVPLPKVWLAWPSPALYAPGDAELDVAAGVLGGGSQARLERILVREQEVARDISVRQVSQGLQGIFVIRATPSQGRTTDEVVEAIDQVLAALRSDPPEEDEVLTAVAGYERQFLDRLATMAGRSGALHSYNHHLGEPDRVSWDLDRYRSVTPASVQEAVARWLSSDRRVVLHVVPEEPAPEEPTHQEVEP